MRVGSTLCLPVQCRKMSAKNGIFWNLHSHSILFILCTRLLSTERKQKQQILDDDMATNSTDDDDNEHKTGKSQTYSFCFSLLLTCSLLLLLVYSFVFYFLSNCFLMIELKTRMNTTSKTDYRCRCLTRVPAAHYDLKSLATFIVRCIGQLPTQNSFVQIFFLSYKNGKNV